VRDAVESGEIEHVPRRRRHDPIETARLHGMDKAIEVAKALGQAPRYCVSVASSAQGGESATREVVGSFECGNAGGYPKSHWASLFASSQNTADGRAGRANEFWARERNLSLTLEAAAIFVG